MILQVDVKMTLQKQNSTAFILKCLKQNYFNVKNVKFFPFFNCEGALVNLGVVFLAQTFCYESFNQIKILWHKVTVATFLD